MKNPVHWFQRHYSIIYKGVLVLASVFLIVQLFPRETRFEYEYQQGRPWLYNDLIAPFDFAVLKTDEELRRERQEVLKDFQPFFTREQRIAEQKQSEFIVNFNLAWNQKYEDDYPEELRGEHLRFSLDILDSVYTRGIIFLDDEHRDKPGDFEIRVIDGNIARTRTIDDFFTVGDAFLFLGAALAEEDQLDTDLLKPLLENALEPNIVYNPDLTSQAISAELEDIPLTRGMVQQGEKIISQGELVTAEKYQVLESFRAEYQRQVGRGATIYLLYLGQFLLVSISIVVLMLFLYVFRKDVFADNRRILLILLSVFLMVLLTSQVIQYNVDFLYLVPVVIVPVIIRAFFDNRLALYVHIITIILIGFLIPRSFEFVFLQFVAGIVAILSMISMRRRSQLFITVGLIFITYSSVFFVLSLAHTGTFENIEWINFAYFAGGAFLTLFAYPLIFMFERLFALPTEFSLLELADTNNKLLRQLAMEAPGTFQHSLQVANLSEEAIFAIGGNSLLTRTGALYHDIGKMENPFFFTENQTTGFNPHEDISNKESAKIIINHVIAGIEMARKNNLPEYLIDFIRTHHGTTTARYFYTLEVNENTEENVDIKDFSYPGPRPFSKETAVVMMADSVEAASRSLNRPDEKQINELVDSIIDTQMKENQFENADITFKDITTTKKIFKRRLLNIFHVRVAYPKLN